MGSPKPEGIANPPRPEGAAPAPSQMPEGIAKPEGIANASDGTAKPYVGASEGSMLLARGQSGDQNSSVRSTNLGAGSAAAAMTKARRVMNCIIAAVVESESRRRKLE